MKDHPKKTAKKISVLFAQTKPEEKIRMTFFLSKNVIGNLELIRLELLKRGMPRRDVSYSNLITEAIGLLEEKHLGGWDPQQLRENREGWDTKPKK
jgi:hypothetical protein